MEEEGWRGEGRAEQIGRAQERRPEENGSVGRDVASADALLPSAYAELRRYGEHAPGGLARPRRAWRLARVRALAPGLQVLAGREETEADTLRDPAGSQELSDESRRTTERRRRRRGTRAHTHTHRGDGDLDGRPTHGLQPFRRPETYSVLPPCVAGEEEVEEDRV